MNKKHRLLLFWAKKAESFWYLPAGVSAANCVGAFQAIGAADLATSYVNLITPGTGNLIVSATGDAPTFDTSYGWAFNGTSNLLETQIVPNNQNWSMMIRFSESENVTWQAIIGINTTNANFSIFPQAAANTVNYYNGGTIQIATRVATGVLGIAGNKGYRNGNVEAGDMSDWTAANTKKIHIGSSGASVFGPSCKIQAVAIFNTTLTPTQMMALYTSMAAL